MFIFFYVQDVFEDITMEDALQSKALKESKNEVSENTNLILNEKEPTRRKSILSFSNFSKVREDSDSELMQDLKEEK